MANKPIDVVPIYSDGIIKNIKNAGYSVRSVAEKTDYSERSIRGYLKRGEMPDKMLRQIDNIVRPKTHRVTAQFDVTLLLADEEYNELVWLSKKYGDVKFEEVGSGYLWSYAGGVQFNSAQISKDEFKAHHEPELTEPTEDILLQFLRASDTFDEGSYAHLLEVIQNTRYYYKISSVKEKAAYLVEAYRNRGEEVPHILMDIINPNK